MRIATWNVNSIRARIDAVVAWAESHQPDVLLLQETKCSDAVFDTLTLRGRLEQSGYTVAHHGTDHYNGVAIASRVGLDDAVAGFPDSDDQQPTSSAVRRRAESADRPHAPDGQEHIDRSARVMIEPRLLTATCSGVRVHNVYVPNGRQAYSAHWEAKLAWLHRARSIVDVDSPTIVAGDFNVQRADIDVYDPRRWRNRNHATPEERAALAAFIELGLRDVVREAHPDPGIYTWWNHAAEQFARNRGMRIDLMLCTPGIAERVERVWIDTAERGRARSSDHAPVVIDVIDV